MKSSYRNILAILMPLVAVPFLLPPNIIAQENPAFYNFPHNHLDWYTIESDHFLVHYQEGNDRPAQVASRISEEIYQPITSFYEYEPDQKISIVLTDREDFGNGAAFFFDNKIEIWLPALDTPLRGTHNWMRNVLTHEFTHIIQLQASKKTSRNHPATYLQWLGYDEVRRPDVLYDFPSTFLSYPLSTITMPAWLAEGTAQYMTEEITYDDWDNIRDMIFRTRILDENQHSLEAMGTFSSKNALERELVYNMGFNFTKYLADRFGPEIIPDITREFSDRRLHDVNRAIDRATGYEGNEVYDQWIAEMSEHYENQISDVSETPEKLIEEGGYFNLYPRFSPDGDEIGYITNREIFNTLVIESDENNDQTAELNVGPILASEHHQHSNHDHHQARGMMCHVSSDEIRRINHAWDFSPSGDSLVFSKHNLNKYGENYRDLHIYDREEEETRQLTESKRLTHPSWSPGGRWIAAMQIEDGSSNLVLYDIHNDTLKTAYRHDRGQQVYEPAWHPDEETIYIPYSNLDHRGIYRFRPFDSDTELSEIFVSEEADFRDPHIDQDGQYLYFSSDRTGIFNIYRKSLDDGSVEQITDVIGGAFMPVERNGKLLYASYHSEGYRIASMELSEGLLASVDLSTESTGTGNPAQDGNNPISAELAAGTSFDLNRFDDTDLGNLEADAHASADTGSYAFQIPTRGQSSDRQLYSYEETFTSFNILPVLRFDNYSQLHGPNRSLLTEGQFGRLGENLWRDSKIGFYLSSFEMRDRFNFFGGIMVGPGSRGADGIGDFFAPGRLINLDRDAFLTVEYTGLPFIERRWNPTISVTGFNIRRNVEDGLSVEDFPCTGCMPDTTHTDIAYDMFELEVKLMSKINQNNLIELTYTHSPYRVSTESFFMNEFQQEVDGTTSRYFIGNTFSTAWHLDAEIPYRNSDIAPLGLTSEVRYSYQPSRLLDNYTVRDGTLVPEYDYFDNHSVELDARYGFIFADQTFSVNSRFFSYLNDQDEYFFTDYIGGFPGMRSYPFYSLGGNTTAYTQLSWFIPIRENIERQINRFTADKIFARLFAEAGNGWGGPLDIGNDIKTGVGAELRFSLNSYYLMPTRLFISGAYGFNSFDLQFPDEFVTTDEPDVIEYGREFMFNFGLLFDFDL